jgi:uncharacterized protein (TIGR02145 family)
MNYSKALLLFALFIVACSNDDNGNNTTPNQITDTRDNQTYSTVTMGTQTWFAENLNYATQSGLSLCYGNDDSNCFLYGRLYRGDEVQSVCPDGWHLPSIEEWQTLFDYVGGIESAHNLLAPYATLQGEPVGFNILTGGFKAVNFQSISERGFYWTSSEDNDPDFHFYVDYDKDDESISFSENALNVGYGMSCRCIKD